LAALARNFKRLKTVCIAMAANEAKETVSAAQQICMKRLAAVRRRQLCDSRRKVPSASDCSLKQLAQFVAFMYFVVQPN
jgi:hypothetical protein